MELASGLNRFVIHTSVHQPVDDKIPGLGLGPFGQWFNRHETWAEEASAWTSYLSRSSYLLQQGKFVADIIYYYGEDNNITSLFGNKLPDIPQGYEYDFVNADALLNLLSIRENRIVTPSGMQYRILALDSNSRYMTLNVLRKINGLVKAGGTVVGPEPVATPSLKDDGTEFNSIVNELWKNPDGVNVIGKGNLFGGKTIREVLDTLKITQDFEYDKTQTGTKLLYVHRKLPSMDIFWINNRNNRVEDLEASFRVSGKSVEIWHPETGKTEPASYAYKEGRTKVSLHLEPNDALFVIFKNGEAKASVSLAPYKETELAKLDGSWAVNFQKDRAAPAGITLEQLSSWTENPDPGVKYFSGTATYTKTITAPANWFSPKSQVWIDLGDVKNLAEVIVNGKSLGIVWKTPFRINATGALKPGSNAIQIKVTNLWVNRLIGDQQPGIQNKITYTTMPFYRADSPLLPSGLLGPVRILSAQ